MALTAINLVIVAIGACLVCQRFQPWNTRPFVRKLILIQCGMGLWVSGKAIHDDTSGASFSCGVRSG